MTESATLEPPSSVTDKSHRDSVEREAIKTLSIAGLTDIGIIERFPHIKPATLRKWRERDPVWSAAFVATRRPVTQSQTVTEEASQLVTKASGDSLAEIHSRTALSLAQASGQVLTAFAQKPTELLNWQDAATAYKVQRLACGVDREGAEVKVNLAMFQAGAMPETGVSWEVEASGEAVEDG